jgi:phage terminase large subunit
MKNLTELTVPAFRYTMMSIYYTVREMFLFGSRKSAKTKHIALRIILRAMSDREYNALCMRKASV